MLLAAGWFAACSSEEDFAETPETPDISLEKPIRFGGKMGGVEQGNSAPAARSTNLEDKQTDFRVWGYKSTTYDPVTDSYDGAQQVFPGYTVKWEENTAGMATDNTHDWYYVGKVSAEGQQQTIKYWDFDATAYRFFAIAGRHSDAWSGFTGFTDPKTGEGKLTDRVSLLLSGLDAAEDFYFTHLWFSNNATDQDMPKYGDPVTLTFLQPFCRVRIMFVGVDGKPLEANGDVAKHITKGSILFEPLDDGFNIHNKGDLFIHYPLAGSKVKERYEAQSSQTDGEIKITIPYESPDSNGRYALVDEENREHWYRLFPRFEMTLCPFRLSILYKGMRHAAIVPAEFMDWQVNTEYTYVFKLDDLGVTFQPELYVHTEWQSGYTTDAPVEW